MAEERKDIIGQRIAPRNEQRRRAAGFSPRGLDMEITNKRRHTRKWGRYTGEAPVPRLIHGLIAGIGELAQSL